MLWDHSVVTTGLSPPYLAAAAVSAAWLFGTIVPCAWLMLGLQSFIQQVDSIIVTELASEAGAFGLAFSKERRARH